MAALDFWGGTFRQQTTAIKKQAAFSTWMEYARVDEAHNLGSDCFLLGGCTTNRAPL